MLFDDAASNYITELEAGAISQCLKDGFHLVLECVDSYSSNLIQQVRHFIAVSRVRGLILTPPLCDMRPLLQELAALNVRIVRISPNGPFRGSAAISINDKLAAYELTQHLINLGHKRIGFVKGKPGHAASTSRFAGYVEAIKANGLIYQPSLCTEGDFSYESGAHAADVLLGQARRPTAIFASNDEMAAGILARSEKYQLKVPTDLSIVGFDDALISQIVSPQLTTCKQPIREMGAAAVWAVLNWKKCVLPIRYLNYDIVHRASSAPPSKQKSKHRKQVTP
jgi:LacI family transcriptional regulator